MNIAASGCRLLDVTRSGQPPPEAASRRTIARPPKRSAAAIVRLSTIYEPLRTAYEHNRFIERT